MGRLAKYQLLAFFKLPLTADQNSVNLSGLTSLAAQGSYTHWRTGGINKYLQVINQAERRRDICVRARSIYAIAVRIWLNLNFIIYKVILLLRQPRISS